MFHVKHFLLFFVISSIVFAGIYSGGVPSDSVTGASLFVDYNHHEIHDGNHYFICDADFDMDSTEQTMFQIVTPNSATKAHMTWMIQATGAVVFSIYESGDFDLDGSALTPLNNDRNSSNTSVLTVQTNGTVNSAGNKILLEAFGVSGNPTNTKGGTASREKEIILKSNTKYIFEIESNTDNNIISWCGEWYEH